jgi:signal transduction histidine kinase
MSAIDTMGGKGKADGYRYFYLKSDINQAKKVIALLSIPILGFILNDYLFFGYSPMLMTLAIIRICLSLILIAELLLIKKVKTYSAYDRVIFSGILLLIIGGGIINLTRPENFILHAIMAIVAIFVIFMLIPLKFGYKCFLTTLMTAGETCIILLTAGSKQNTELFTIILCMVTGFILAAFSSWQMHTYRIQTFEESIRRIQLQEELRNNADNLAQLVDLKTKELVDAQGRLVKSERLAAIGELAGLVGHDLRNPLAGIKNAAYFLRKKNSNVLDASGHKMLATIDRSVEHADKIIRDLLEYSRDIRLEYKEQTPKSIINYVLLSIQIPDQIHIIDNTEPTPMIVVDGSKMERVFSNLIKNAIEAMPEGGTLEIVSRQNENNIEFVFADTGSGIPQELVSKLFAPLVTTKAQGMGFGLAICKRFIEAHGGEISVKSIINKGTTFTLVMPQSPSNYGFN